MKNKKCALCEKCGKEFVKKKKKQLLCSRKCNKIIIFPDKICLQCKKNFNRGRSKKGRLERIDDFKIRNFCSKVCAHAYNSGTNHHLHKGNRQRKDGYVKYFNDYVHRNIMEKHLGRKLRPEEHVHHIDGNRSNNDIENLIVISSAMHSKIHTEMRLRDEKGRFC